jgi:hypothetical protein
VFEVAPKARTIAYWIVTVLFCVQIGFTAYFRVELSWAKFLGIALLLAPAPVRLKEWAYAGFAITLGSAVIAHLAVGDGPQAWSWAVGASVLLGLSYILWLRVPPTLASAWATSRLEAERS